MSAACLLAMRLWGSVNGTVTTVGSCPPASWAAKVWGSHAISLPVTAMLGYFVWKATSLAWKDFRSAGLPAGGWFEMTMLTGLEFVVTATTEGVVLAPPPPLLHAARHPVAGIVVVAPHLFVEHVSISNIAAARTAYETTDLRQRLARHHADVDSAFRGWNDVWLSPAFRGWNIEAEIGTITCPVFAVQGEDDEYGTLRQIHAIREHLPQTRLCVLAHCGHSPHRDQPEALIREAGAFIHTHKN